ncbi:MAG: DUF192 domain-containing protein [bacterium]
MRITATLFGIFLAAIIASSGCQKTQGTGEQTGTGQATTAAQGEQAAAEAVGTIVVGSTPFSVEIAETEQQKEKGLMGRESLPESAGMWFVFDQPVSDNFWMKDTTIPLDMIFVDENLRVIYIAANTVPGSTEMIKAPSPYQYVLEVNAGVAAKSNIKVGDQIQKRLGNK